MQLFACFCKHCSSLHLFYIAIAWLFPQALQLPASFLAMQLPASFLTLQLPGCFCSFLQFLHVPSSL